MGAEPTREILWNVDRLGRIAVYVLMLVPLLLATYGLSRRVALWRTGVAEDRFDRPAERFKGALLRAIMHRRIVRPRNLYGGLMHAGIFWGFVTLLIGTIIVMIEDDITRPIFGFSFYRGTFYLFYKLAMNLGGLLLIAAVLVAFYRRYGLSWKTIETTADDEILLCLLLALTVQGFALQALRLSVQDQEWAAWSFVSYPMALSLRGLSPELLSGLHRLVWWSHMLLTFVFIGFVSYSKMVHAFTGLTGVYLRRLKPLGQLDRIENIEEAETLGVSKLEQFSWAKLMSVDACMHCGRCLEYCPTFNTAKALRPRDLVLEIAGYAADRGGVFSGVVGQGENSARYRSGSGAERELIGEVVTEEELWDCTTCGACMYQCPVHIEHVPIIVDLRRSLVMEQSSFPPEVTSVFNNLERFSSVYPFLPAQRAEWTEKLDRPVPEMADLPSGEAVEVLFFVGCLGSFDPRNQRTTLALARVMQAAGINFAILGKEETCTGDPARRIGNEYLAQVMAQQTVETLNRYSFKKIVTACPHCFNAIKNEFPQIGGRYEIVHHSQLIAQLLSEGRLKLDPDSAIARGTVTYHDPCYLGRYNDEFEQPRAVVSGLPGAELVEMPRNRGTSFCCGGGGGRLFMEEKSGTRINRARVREAIDTGASILAAACPFCMTMFEDGIKGEGAEESFKVLDLAELVSESLVASDRDGGS